MALGATIAANILHNEFTKTLPYSTTAGWQTVIDAGGMIILDAATITNPTTQITDSTRHIFSRIGQGSTLLLSMLYDNGLTVPTAPVVKVFGRTGTDQWRVVEMRNSAAIRSSISMITGTDATNGTLKATTPSYNNLAWDCIGYEELLVGIEGILSGTGTVNNALLQAKFV